ncbi:MAG: haloalkane dehalogenase [Nocardioides sp.]
MERRSFIGLGAAAVVAAGTGWTATNASAGYAGGAVGRRWSTDSPSTPYGTIYRTPARAFRHLPEFPFRPRFAQVDRCGLLMSYVDAGRRDGPVVLLLHGNPAWSYTYRSWIPPLVARGYRVIAPDLIGFGRSDKLDREQYTYQRQVDWACALVRRLNLRDVTMFAHDWGGLIYLRVAAEMPDRFARIAIANTGLPLDTDPYEESFVVWQEQISQTTPAFGPLIDSDSLRDLTDAEVAAFDAPWPTEQLRGAPRQMPWEVPGSGRNVEQGAANLAAREFFRSWEKPMLTLWSEDEAILPADYTQFFREQVPGGRNMPHQDFPSGHFIQEEEVAPQLVAAIVSLVETTG